MRGHGLLAYATTAVAISAVSLVSPALPELAEHYGVSDSEIAALQVAVLVPGILSARFLLGPGSRRGVPRMLSWTLLVYGITGGLLVWVTYWPVVLAIRLVQGFVCGGLLAGAFALLSGSGNRERLIVRNAALVCAMMALQPLLGSALANLGPQVPFAFYLAAVPLGLVMARVRAEAAATTGARGHAVEPAEPAPSVATSLVLTVVINLLLFGWLLYLAPVVLAGEHGLSVGARGAMLSAQALLAGAIALLAAPVIRRGRARMLLGAGLLLPIIGLVGVASTTTTTLAVVGFGLVGTVYGTANPAILSFVTRYGRHATGAWQSSARVGQVAGPALAGWLLATVSVDATVVIGAVLGGLGLAVLPLRPQLPRLERALVGTDDRT